MLHGCVQRLAAACRQLAGCDAGHATLTTATAAAAPTRISSHASLSSPRRLSLLLLSTTRRLSSESESLEPAKNLRKGGPVAGGQLPPISTSAAGGPGRSATNLEAPFLGASLSESESLSELLPSLLDPLPELELPEEELLSPSTDDSSVVASCSSSLSLPAAQKRDACGQSRIE